MTFWPENTYEIKNVRFLAIFITEAAVLIKRSKTGISAKAQRKTAREIKTARAFGLMQFTTMEQSILCLAEQWRTLMQIMNMRCATPILSTGNLLKPEKILLC